MSLKSNDAGDNEEAVAQCLCGVATLSSSDQVASLCFTSLIDEFSGKTKNIRELSFSKDELKPFSPMSFLSLQSSPKLQNRSVNKISAQKEDVNGNTESNDDGYADNRLTAGSNKFRSKNIEQTDMPKFQTAAAAMGLMNGVKKNKISKSQGNNGDSGRISNVPKKGEMNENTDERLKNIEPQMIEKIENEILISTPSVSWDDIAGLSKAKMAVKETIIFPMQYPHLFQGLRAPSRGVLLFGPPGTGKTLIAQALANEAKCTFFNISASSLISKWVGEGEKLTRALFCVARVKSPSIIFIDEIDSILIKRTDNEAEGSRRVKTEFLLQFQGVSSGDEPILILGATNRPQDLDDAALRRFEKRIYIPLPDFETRISLINILLKNSSHEISDEQINEIAELTDGYSCADITTLFREAAMISIREIISNVNIHYDEMPEARPIYFEDVKNSLKRVKSSVSPDSIKQYEDWNKEFGYGSS